MFKHTANDSTNAAYPLNILNIFLSSLDCGLPMGPGTRVGPGCDKNITSYYYDVTKGTCEAFTYSGCGGNVNRFEDEEACMEKCNRPGNG